MRLLSLSLLDHSAPKVGTLFPLSTPEPKLRDFAQRKKWALKQRTLNFFLKEWSSFVTWIEKLKTKGVLKWWRLW